MLFSLLNLQAAIADPDLPGASQNLENIPTGSLIIPMDNALQAQGLTAAVGFNLNAYGLANKMLQNNIPVKWAIRYNKPKIRGIVTVTQATCSPLTSGASDFVTAGVQVGDLVTNVTDGMTRGRVTALTATTLTLATLNGDALDCAIDDEFIVDGADFMANAKRIRPAPDVAAANVYFAGGPFIIANVADHVARAKVIAAAFTANAPQGANVTVYETTGNNSIDIRYSLEHKPFAAVSDFNTVIHSSALVAAGIPGANACVPLPGQPGFDPNSCNWNQVDPVNLASYECATIHLEPHRDGQANPTPPLPNNEAEIAQVVDAVEAFVEGGGNFLGQCHATQYFENYDVDVPPNTVGKFLTEFGIADDGGKDILTYPNSRTPYNQITGPLDGEQGGSVTSWNLNGGAFKNEGYDSAHLISETTVQKAIAGKVVTPNDLGGNVMYLGGHNFNKSELAQINGRRMVLNALFIPPDRPFNCGLTINGALIIEKRVVNDGGGLGDVSDFNIETDAGTLNFDGGVADGANTLKYTADTLTVLAGVPYSLKESDAPGYSEGTWTCTGGDNLPAGAAYDNATVTLQPGVTKTCTITNDDQPTTLTVRKRIVNASGGTAVVGDFNITTSAGALNFGSAVEDPTNTFLYTATALNVTPDQEYTLVEGNVSGYTEGDWSCTGGDNQGGGDFDDGKVTVAAGLSKVCTITNSDESSSLIIVKQVVNDNGGTAVVGDFSVTTSAGALSFGSGVGAGSTKTYTATALIVEANKEYTLSESDVTGYTEGTWDCVGGDDAGGGAYNSGTVTLASGVSKTCTIINDDIAPQLSLTKKVVNDDGSTNVAADWTLFAEGGTDGFSGNPAGTDEEATLGPYDVTAGVAYALSESATPSGYIASAFTCDGGDLDGANITLDVGDVVDCEITNDDALADIDLEKTVNGPAVKEGDGTYTVVYTITATNSGAGSGEYDLDDLFSPGSGITLNSASAVYKAGTEDDQSGTPGPYPKFVDDEALAAGKDESWEVEANFVINLANVSESDNECDGAGTGFYNYVSGVVDEEDLSNNDACTSFEIPPEKTTFRVTKDFTDDNDSEVQVTLNCYTGLPLTQSQMISEFPDRDVVFIMEKFDAGTLDCEIFEDVPEGYTPTYEAAADLESETPGDAEDISDDAEGCHFTGVYSGDFLCHIVNTPDPVEVVIEKKWIIEGMGGDQVNQHFLLTLYCDGEIVGGDEKPKSIDTGCWDVNAPNGYDWCEEYEGTGDDTFTAHVIPEYPSSHCVVWEHVYDDSIEVDNGCLDLVVSAGQGDSCLITNTVFYEGIPTLNQYGMMVLALLMLGMGMVGFRRFV